MLRIKRAQLSKIYFRLKKEEEDRGNGDEEAVS